MSEVTRTGWIISDTFLSRNVYEGEIGHAHLSINSYPGDEAFAEVVKNAFLEVGNSVTARSLANAANLQTVTIVATTAPERSNGAALLGPGVGRVVISASELGMKYGVAGKKGVYEVFDVRHALAHELVHILGAKGILTLEDGTLHNKLTNKILKELGIPPRTFDYFDIEKCFLAGTMIDMWPVEADLKMGADGLYDEEEVRAKVCQKPIEEVAAKDWVLSFDQDGNLKPGRVKRTFENEAKIILDFHGTFVTPAHVYYCAGGTYEGKFVPLIDILRDDGVVQHADGSLIRASTGCEVGSEDDKPFWAFLLYEDLNGMECVREKRQLRLGTRWMMPNGRHFSIREYMEGCGIELVESGEFEGYVRFKKTGLTTVFAWTLSDTLPYPEDFVLRRSQTTLEEIYRASEWESVHPQMPAPVTMDSGPVQPLSVQQFDNMPRNNPIGFQNNSPSSELKLNRKARKAEAARQRKIKKNRQKADRAMGTLH